MGVMPRWRRWMVLTVTVAFAGALAAVLVMTTGFGTSAVSRGASTQAPTSVRKSAERNGLAVHLSATEVRPPQQVEVSVKVEDGHTRGAFAYSLHFGDGTVAHNRVPQFCLAGAGTRQQASWHFTHRYVRPGSYRVSVIVRVNCTSTVATASVVLRVG